MHIFYKEFVNSYCYNFSFHILLKKYLWHLQQTVLATILEAIVESSPPQNPSNAMAKDVPPVLDGDGMIAQSYPVAVLPQSVL